MNFLAVVDQVIALLRQRGRLTYRTLQRQFQLDAEALEDLTFELIKGQRLAVDEDGEVLVWIGEPLAAHTRRPTRGRGREAVPCAAPGGDGVAPASRGASRTARSPTSSASIRRCWRSYGKNSPSDDLPVTRAGEVWSGRGRDHPSLPLVSAVPRPQGPVDPTCRHLSRAPTLPPRITETHTPSPAPTIAADALATAVPPDDVYPRRCANAPWP